MSLEAWLSDLVGHSSIVFSHVVGSWLAGQDKGCHCSCHLGQTETDSHVLDILQHQLERCGPENLSAYSAGRHWLLNVLLYLVLVLTGFGVGWAARGRKEVLKHGKDIHFDDADELLAETQRALRIKRHGVAAW